jgi:DNA-binding IclR family transcriptional regulator
MPAEPRTPRQPAPPVKKAVRVRDVPAVTRSIAILRLLGRTKQSLGVKAIADELGLVPSTCLHILRVLVSEELVKVEPGTKHYAMGVEVTPKQTVVVLALSRSDQPFRMHTDVGSQFSSLVSATGRLIAAYSGDNWTVLRQKFAAIEWDKAPSFAQWKKEVEETRARGWSSDRDNFMSGITVVAVPIFEPSGRLMHTLVSVGLSSQLHATAMAQLAAAMRREAESISDLLLDRH